MSVLINIVRNLLGGIIVLLDLLTRPRKLQRSQAAQQQIANELESMALYQFFACPFCIKTRRAMHRLNLPIRTRNATKGSIYRDELASLGGKVQVPCLRITEQGEDRWLYDSKAIIAYLEQRFAPQQK